MFEAYKVGVTLALTNQVSSVLGLIARDFIKVKAETKALQAALTEIKLLGMSGAILGGAGFLGLGLISRAVKPATEYVHQLELAKTAGMTQLEIAKATGAAWEATSSVITTTATQNLASIRELRMVFGSTTAAIEHMPTVQRLQGVLQNIRGGSPKDEAYTVAKALEMKGSVRDVNQFDTAANLMTKALNAGGGKVNAADFLSAFKYGRAATIGWNDNFTYSILPTLIQEMKSAGGAGGSGGPGNALMSAYSAVVGGTIPQKALKVWQQMGLLDPSKVVWDKVGSAKGVGPGGIRGSEVFQQNPYEWTQKYLIPALKQAGYSTEAQQRQALQYLFPNRTAGFVMSQMALQGWKFDRDQSLIGKAQGLGSYDEIARNDPKTALVALSAQWENFKTAVGIAVVPIILPALRGMTTALNSLSRFLYSHPLITTALAGTFTALSGLAAISGTLMIAGAAIKLMGPAFKAFGMVAPAASGLLASFTGLLPVMGALAAVAGTIALIWNHKGVADWIDQKTGGKVGDFMVGVGDVWNSVPSANQYGFTPPASASKATVNLEVRDPYHLAKVVTDQQVKHMSGPPGSGAGFDGRQSPIWPSYNPGF